MPGAMRSRRRVLRKAFELVVVRYAFALVMVAAAFGLRKLLEPITGSGAPFVLFFAAVTITAIFAGPGPGICAALLSIPLGAYVFVARAGSTESQAATQAALFAHRTGARRVLPRRPRRSVHGRQPERLPDAPLRA